MGTAHEARFKEKSLRDAYGQGKARSERERAARLNAITPHPEARAPFGDTVVRWDRRRSVWWLSGLNPDSYGFWYRGKIDRVFQEWRLVCIGWDDVLGGFLCAPRPQGADRVE